MNRCARVAAIGAVAAAFLALPQPLAAQEQGGLAGEVVDQLGGRISNATVRLVDQQRRTEPVATAVDGTYRFEGLGSGRYQVLAAADGFSPFASEPFYLGAASRLTVNVTLQVGPLQQAVVVTASASELPESQTGAPVTVITAETIEALNKPDLLEALRLVPGAQVEQSGGRGGSTSMFIRGGSSNFAKVLVDGIAVNDIGGGFDFSQIQTTGIAQVEVLRQSNSVIYGSDALTGVVSVVTPRGRTRTPALSYSVDGGNLNTFRNTGSVGGTLGRLDYFTAYSYLTTDNSVPNNAYRNHTFATRVGVALGARTDLSGTLRHVDGMSGSPNGISLFGIADDGSSETRLTYAGVTAESQWTDRWQSTVRFGSTDQTMGFVNPAPTGEPFDPFGFGANYLGDEVTITGANGYSATGRAILDFGGVYPSSFESRTTRRELSGQTTYRLGADVHVSAGARLEREQGFDDPLSDPTETRNNGGLFVEARGSVASRLYVGAGIGYDYNAAFTSTVTPRLSVATYLRDPAPGAFGDMKVVFNAGKGIKAPSVFQGQNSLFALLEGTGSAVQGLGPERSRSLDVGLEQGLADGRVRVRVSFFDNTFEDLIEFVNNNVLPQVGVPLEVAEAVPFGAYVNSSSHRARGIETSAEALLAGRLRLMGSYTFMDAEVTKSFTTSALEPAINPSIPGIPIGAFAPLIGERPFRRPTHAGTLLASYVHGPGQITLSAYFSGKRDGSTFLSDQFFGNSMLLPNRSLEADYQKVDLGGSYRARPRLKVYVSIENLLNSRYESSFGFPALQRTVRTGLTVDLGGG